MQKIAGINECVLIRQMKNGDQHAFELLFKHYYPGLLVFASQIVQDREEAIEIVQNFFVKFWIKRETIKNEKSVKTYLFSSIRNRSINFLKKQQCRKIYIERMKSISENELLYDPDVYIASELQQKIKTAVDNLPSRCGEIFVMSRFQGLSNDEIAEQLQLSKRTVETQISNALKILRVNLKDYLEILILIDMLS